jgi:hypothetical protein
VAYLAAYGTDRLTHVRRLRRRSGVGGVGSIGSIESGEEVRVDGGEGGEQRVKLAASQRLVGTADEDRREAVG